QYTTLDWHGYSPPQSASDCSLDSQRMFHSCFPEEVDSIIRSGHLSPFYTPVLTRKNRSRARTTKTAVCEFLPASTAARNSGGRSGFGSIGGSACRVSRWLLDEVLQLYQCEVRETARYEFSERRGGRVAGWPDERTPLQPPGMQPSFLGEGFSRVDRPARSAQALYGGHALPGHRGAGRSLALSSQGRRASRHRHPRRGGG